METKGEKREARAQEVINCMSLIKVIKIIKENKVRKRDDIEEENGGEMED